MSLTGVYGNHVPSTVGKSREPVKNFNIDHAPISFAGRHLGFQPQKLAPFF